MSKRNFSELVASRICHDLISPVGAISNGIELVEMSDRLSPELLLVADSARAASAHVRLFRIAFGQASADQQVGAHEMRHICHDMCETRVQYDWQIAQPMARPLVRAACLAMLCLDHALPRGGSVVAELSAEDVLQITADGPKLRFEDVLWHPLLFGRPLSADQIDNYGADTVNFALLPDALAELGRKAKIRIDETRISISF